MNEQFPHLSQNESGQRMIEKQEHFLVTTREELFDYIAGLVKQPRGSLDFNDVTLEQKQKLTREFLTKQYPELSLDEITELQEVLLEMW